MKQTSLVRPFFFIAVPVAAVLVLVVYVGLELYSHLTNSQQFAVQKVEVLTEGPAKKEDLIRSANIRLHANIFSLDLAKAQKNIESNPWVYSATVSRALPNMIQIQYVPQEPVAILNSSDSLYYLNREGRAFYKINKGDSLQFPLIHFEGAPKLDQVPADRLAAALEIIQWSKTSKVIHSQDLGDITLRGSVYAEQLPLLVTLAYPPSKFAKQKLKRRFFTLSLGEKEILPQTKRAETVLQHLVQQGKNPRLIRLELGKKIVVKIDQKL